MSYPQKILDCALIFGRPEHEFLLRADGRVEWICEHGIGHTVWPAGNRTPFLSEIDAYLYGCDRCQSKLKRQTDKRVGVAGQEAIDKNLERFLSKIHEAKVYNRKGNLAASMSFPSGIIGKKFRIVLVDDEKNLPKMQEEETVD